jgi:RNA polymerase sigma factor (sigma-70 family)
MAGRAATLLKCVYQSAKAGESPLSDRDLLRHFAAGDQDAFATLVARHATMVFGACRRYLACAQDAEDACQATFLILAQRAAHTRWQPSIANWLHTTTRRVASRMRRTAERRLQREALVAVRDPTSVLDEISGRELLSMLDEDLNALSAPHREALILCCLEGLSREEAADQIGIPLATLKTRLERGRKQLEVALARRGIALGVLLLAVGSTGACPPQLSQNIRTALASTPSPLVRALPQEISMSAFRNSLIATLVTVAAIGLGLGIHITSPVTANEEQPASAIEKASEAAIERLKERETFGTGLAAPKPAADKFEEEVAVARRKAVQFLKAKQTREGNWEAALPTAGMEGGTTALIVLSLLEAGVPAKDPFVASSIDYLASLPPKKTYAVGLQTQVLARADAKKHAPSIQKNADWLLDQAIGWRKGGKIEGWSYAGGVTRGDGSNTHFAVMGLHAATRAGAKVDDKVWESIRDHYLRTRIRGGWSYIAAPDGASPATESMTTAALVGLTLVKKHDKATDATREAMGKGLDDFLAFSSRNGKSTGYQDLISAELGRLMESNEFKSGDKVLKWYHEGAERLLKNQKPDGSWSGTGIDANALLNTAFSLYFLGPEKK